MTEDISQLVRQAEAAANAGQWAAAEKLWSDVRRRDPRNPKAAFGLGVHAMQRRDFSAAAALIEEAQQASPHDPFILLTLSRAKRNAGDETGEATAIERALAIDPYFLPALLAKAQRLERIGNQTAAAMFFRNAVKVAGAEAMWPEVLRPQMYHARDAAARHAHNHQAELDAALAPMLSSLSRSQAERWREAASVMAGLTEPYHQHANQLHVPRLPAIPFYDRDMFPWAAELESRTEVIREELKAALADEQDFQPYIKLRPGQPVDQWRDLNQSARWSHYGLWRNGQPDEAHLAKCPETRRALEMIDMAEIAGLCPNAMFSALAPHTEIPPHTGETNARLVAHLPLVVPEKCTYRVGFEHRTWTEGQLLVFDDTIEHTARNDSDELRIILIFDVWNPLLAAEERDVVRALASATRAFNAAH
ncbi:MAG: aspartyl/asparaginyl beta-hydroxylase domain-containing protein [Hyphomonadaceae bacterium]|nr:aspartyl/asparaginyl beta-hydroxylase domain-containing protein [Hyphomonadaceae bacterium]